MSGGATGSREYQDGGGATFEQKEASATTMAFGGTIMRVASNNMQYEEQRDAFNFNIQQARLQEKEILRRMELNTRIMKRQKDAERGQQVTAFGASGIDVGSGSPLEFLADQEAIARREIAEFRYDATLRAEQAAKQRRLLERQKRRAKTARDMKNIGTFLDFGIKAATAGS